MAEVKWIKIVTDIFDDEKVLLIETLPDADSIIVIWFKLICLAGKQNNSGVFMLNNRMPYDHKMFSTIFRRKESTVQLALQTFEQFGMIEIIENTVTIPNWAKHQNLDQLENKKEYMRDYMQDYRSKQRLIATSTVCKTNSKTNSKTNVSSLDKTRLDKTREDKSRLDKDTTDTAAHIINYLNQVIKANYKVDSKVSQSHINARLSEGYAVEDFRIVIQKKYAEWNGTDMQKFLRPETLFGTKFESYLNAPSKKTSKDSILEWVNENG